MAAVIVLANLDVPAALAAPTITLSASSGEVSDRIDVEGSGFTPFLEVQLSFAGESVATATPKVSGDFHEHFNVPKTRHGDAMVTATNGVESASATFAVQNAPPVASDMQVTADEDGGTDIMLAASDDNGDPLTFAIVESPHNGVLAGSMSAAGAVTYTPNANFSGTDSFTFKATDGAAESNTATVSVTISATNDLPVTADQSVSVNEDEITSIALAGSDPDGDPLTFSIVSGPSHGVLTGSAPNLAYDSQDNYSGTDSFTFKANDGRGDSNVSTVNISVIAIDDPPTAAGATATVAEDSSVTLSLSASDVDSDSVVFTIASSPLHGRLDAVTQTNPMSAAVTYYPNPNYSGTDSFTFKATDGVYESPAVQATISISPANDAPVVSDVQQSLEQGSAVTLVLQGTDVDGNPLTFSLVRGPEKGTLGQITSTGPVTATVVYTPGEGQTGTDAFSFKTNDGTADSNVATAFLTINAAPLPSSPPSPPQDALRPEENPPATEEPQAPSSSLINVIDAIAIQDSATPDASIAPVISPGPAAHETQAAPGGGNNQNSRASFPTIWLLSGVVASAGAAGAFLAYRRRWAQKVAENHEPPSPPSPQSASLQQQTAVMKEAHRVFSMLGDEKSKAAQEHVYEVAFAGAPAGASYESDRELLKQQFTEISSAVMSDPLLNAMFMDSFAEVAIKVWRALAKVSPGDPDLEPLELLGKEAEKYWTEHDREPIVV